MNKFAHPWNNSRVALADAQTQGIAIGAEALIAINASTKTAYQFRRVNRSLPLNRGDWAVVDTTWAQCQSGGLPKQ